MFEKQKKEIIAYGNKLIQKKLSRSTGGNISIYIRDKNIMLITPSSIEYDELKIDDIVEMELSGKQLSAFHFKPSSEWRMHTEVYKNRTDINAMFHAHAIYSMVISASFNKLPAIDYLVAFSGNHEIPVVKYSSYGTEEIAQKSLSVLKTMNAVLLQNHGINTIGRNIYEAFRNLELLELCAEMYCKSKMLGEPRIIDKAEMQRLVKIFVKGKYEN